jgi:HK97 family phage major capsid protein
MSIPNLQLEVSKMNIQSPSALEHKSADPEIADAFGEFMTSFEVFKEANDEKLAQLERRVGGDIVTTEKIERIQRVLDEQKRALDHLSLKRARPALGREGRAMPSEHKGAFEAYMRSGDDRLIRSLDTKAMSYGSGQDGGYLVPDETEAEIGKRLSALSPIRSTPRCGRFRRRC